MYGAPVFLLMLIILLPSCAAPMAGAAAWEAISQGDVEKVTDDYSITMLINRFWRL
jgi:hypothetical protein